MSKEIDKLLKDVADGKDFSNKSSIDPLNALDFLKKEVCLFFVREILNGVSENLILERCKFTSEVEFKALIRYRTERLTLERLIEIIDNYRATITITELKLRLLDEIHKVGYSKIKMTQKIRMLIEGKATKTLSLDFLVDVFDRCGGDQIDMRSILLVSFNSDKKDE